MSWTIDGGGMAVGNRSLGPRGGGSMRIGCGKGLRGRRCELVEVGIK